MARSVILGHLRKQVRHSLKHQVGHIKVHHASIQGRENLLIVFLPILYKKIIPIKHQATTNNLFLSTKGVILKLCMFKCDLIIKSYSLTIIFFDTIKYELNMNSRKKFHWNQKNSMMIMGSLYD